MVLQFEMIIFISWLLICSRKLEYFSYSRCHNYHISKLHIFKNLFQDAKIAKMVRYLFCFSSKHLVNLIFEKSFFFYFTWDFPKINSDSLMTRLSHTLLIVNPFAPNAPFLYPLKKSENLAVLLMFSVGRERAHREQMS